MKRHPTKILPSMHPACTFSSSSAEADDSNWVFFLILEERIYTPGLEKSIDLLFHLFMHSLVACMCPDRGLNPEPWCIRMML